MGTRGPWPALALSGALILAAGCGDDDGDGSGSSRDDYVDAIADAFEDDGELNDEAKVCIAEAYVDAIGVESFEEADISPRDIRDDPDATPEELGLELTEDQLTKLSQAALACPGIDGSG